MSDKKFRYDQQTYASAQKLSDSMVYEFEFVNLATNDVTINDSIVLKTGSTTGRMTNRMYDGQKSAQTFTIKFDAPDNDPDNLLLVITKTPVQ